MNTAKEQRSPFRSQTGLSTGGTAEIIEAYLLDDLSYSTNDSYWLVFKRESSTQALALTVSWVLSKCRGR